MATKDDDRLMDDLLASLAGETITDAFAGTKKAAHAGGVQSRQARRWATGENSPLTRVRELVEKADNPWAIVCYLNSVAVLVELQRSGPLTEWRWRSEYVKACEAEQPHDGNEDCVTQKVMVGHASVADQMNADMDLLAPLTRRLALSIIGSRRSWSLSGPRAHQS